MASMRLLHNGDEQSFVNDSIYSNRQNEKWNDRIVSIETSFDVRQRKRKIAREGERGDRRQNR